MVAGFTTLSHMLVQVGLLGAWRSRTGSKELGSMGTVAPNSEDLAALRRLLERGEVVPVIDRLYALSEAAEAIRYVEGGRARGKVVLHARLTPPGRRAPSGTTPASAARPAPGE